MPAFIFAPDTLKLVEEDTVPDVVVNADGVPLVEITGMVTVLEGILTFTVVAEVLLKTILPE